MFLTKKKDTSLTLPVGHLLELEFNSKKDKVSIKFVNSEKCPVLYLNNIDDYDYFEKCGDTYFLKYKVDNLDPGDYLFYINEYQEEFIEDIPFRLHEGGLTITEVS